VPAKISGYPATEPVAPLKVSNGSSVAADKSQIESSAAAAGSQTSDQVTLTNSARSLQKLSEAVAQSPVVDAAKVASVKQAVDSGTYQIDAGSIADKMLRYEKGLAKAS